VLEVALLCGKASGLASSLCSSLHPGRWNFSPGVTCTVEQAVFSYHVSDEAVLGLQHFYVTLYWYVLT